ncbi:MAG: DUF423 domain-containing protein [Gammaproteobacteria bacterium]|nr:DUF423 domain-containing protein [Gammaproteobacteria bacterium]
MADRLAPLHLEGERDSLDNARDALRIPLPVKATRTLALAGLILALATALSAWGAHALRPQLPPERYFLWETAVRYQYWQGLGLLGLAATRRTLDGRGLRIAAALVFAGLLLFSGSLYALALHAPRALGVLTPVGGVASILGWLAFAWGTWRGRDIRSSP